MLGLHDGPLMALVVLDRGAAIGSVGQRPIPRRAQDTWLVTRYRSALFAKLARWSIRRYPLVDPCQAASELLVADLIEDD